MKKIVLGLFCLMTFSLLFTSCQSDEKEQQNKDMVDSVVNQVIKEGDTLAAPSSPVVPELIGSWIVVEMRLDGKPLSQDDIGKLIYNFEDEGKLVFDSKDKNEDFAPESFKYSYNQNVIYTPHFPTGEARITQLNTDTLSFTIEAAGSKVEYVLERQ